MHYVHMLLYLSVILHLVRLSVECKHGWPQYDRRSILRRASTWRGPFKYKLCANALAVGPNKDVVAGEEADFAGDRILQSSLKNFVSHIFPAQL